MAGAVAALQDPKGGLWHSDMLDPEDYPQPEVSGSALMTFALAWGVTHHILDRATYMPVIAKAWRGLVGQIYADGRLGNIQQIGAAAAHYAPSSSYNYGVGAFLLAGAQVVDLRADAVMNREANERECRDLGLEMSLERLAPRIHERRHPQHAPPAGSRSPR